MQQLAVGFAPPHGPGCEVVVERTAVDVGRWLISGGQYVYRAMKSEPLPVKRPAPTIAVTCHAL